MAATRLRIADVLLLHNNPSGGSVSYQNKVLRTGPIAYFPLWETSGTAAVCQVNVAQNGTYARNVTTMGTGTGIGDGNTAPDFDGTNDHIDIQSATLASAFSGVAGSFHAWYKVSAAGVWTDGTVDRLFYVTADVNNIASLVKLAANNEFRWYYKANTTEEIVTTGSLSATGWIPVGMTWSDADDKMIAYWNGVQSGATQTGLGTWAGSPATTFIGATDAVPTAPLNGYAAHAAIWDRALTAGEMAKLASV